MAFNREDPADLLALQVEVNTDPIGMGYNPGGNTQQLLKLLNDPANNVGGETAARPFDGAAMLDALDPTDFGAQQTTDGAPVYTAMLVNQSAAFGNGIEDYKAKWASMFAGNSTTAQALNAQTAPLSRAEVLFGQGTELSKEDWFAARDFQP